MRLCMFTPVEADLERGWPGRIEGGIVVGLAAQTLQSFFTGGASAREHAEYPLADVLLRAPLLEPPAMRPLDAAPSFSFADPSAIGHRVPSSAARSTARSSYPGRCGDHLDGAIGGWTGPAGWRAPDCRHPRTATSRFCSARSSTPSSRISR